jgi:hypothetical protein
MTREEAARDIDNTACCFSDKQFRDAMHMAADALRGPQPDPITGLVPCGCGGKAANEDFFDGFFHLSRVTCPKCGIEVTTADGQAKAAWNRAMGMPEVEG